MLDGIGVALSGACLVHCMVMPFAAVLLSVWGLDAFLHEGFHRIMVALLVFNSAFAFVPGYRAHRRPVVLGWMAPGLATLIFTSFFLHRIGLHAWETPLNLLGGALSH